MASAYDGESSPQVDLLALFPDHQYQCANLGQKTLRACSLPDTPRLIQVLYRTISGTQQPPRRLNLAYIPVPLCFPVSLGLRAAAEALVALPLSFFRPLTARVP
jgi:hypothetical protein